MQVYLLQGWMGDIEWLEGEAHAQSVADELWTDRASKYAPEWTHGFCKFAVEPYPVIDPSAKAHTELAAVPQPAKEPA